jgi:peptidoglycan/xylan/chitin deacetylase (PgdA/CDA1 family)
MVRQKFPCKNHSEKLTTKRCINCKEYICSYCQKKWSHHLFCSYICFIKFLLSEYAIYTKSNYKIILLFLFTQLLTIIIILQFIPDNEQIIETRLKNLQYSQFSKDTIKTFTIDTSSVPNSNQILFSGKTTANSLLGLWHNRKIIQSKISKNETYKFNPTSLYLGNNSFKIARINSNGEIVLIDSIHLKYNSVRISKLMESVSKIKTDNLVLSLTFDGGSNISGADSILKILYVNNIQTTFFLTGEFIIRNPELTEKILKARHEIGNHTYSHQHLTQFEKTNEHSTLKGVNRDFLQKELLKTDSVFYANFQQNMMQYWRAPFGEYNNEILQWAAEIGYKHVRWSKSCDLLDWVSDTESPLYKKHEDMYQNLIDLHQNNKLKGSIILMHLGTDRRDDLPYRMLPKLIYQLKNKDYEFVKISDLIKFQISS